MTLDELLLEWSYRSEKGYPCLDSPSDILMLKSILKELKHAKAIGSDISKKTILNAKINLKKLKQNIIHLRMNLLVELMRNREIIM